eukprot:gene23098-biopygen5800
MTDGDVFLSPRKVVLCKNTILSTEPRPRIVILSLQSMSAWPHIDCLHLSVLFLRQRLWRRMSSSPFLFCGEGTEWRFHASSITPYLRDGAVTPHSPAAPSAGREVLQDRYLPAVAGQICRLPNRRCAAAAAGGQGRVLGAWTVGCVFFLVYRGPPVHRYPPPGLAAASPPRARVSYK